MNASTLMETLIATVLVMVIFMVASLILNNMFSNSIKNNRRAITSKINAIEYLYINDKITLPYQDDYEDWMITMEPLKNTSKIGLKATNEVTGKTIEKIFYKR
ncbi:hypothetical protein [Winogradskyella flava]|nr:hypothetical protein [Winogradskyella flava]